ncbi:MAG: SAP domain-containing protein [Chloroflexi bacterium]|nr:SAP domain-containing protein [Chloroflexota bacterium]
MSRLKQEKLAEMTVAQLREMLRHQGLSTSGSKQNMIDRLLMANPAGPGVMVVETVSASRRKKSTPMPEEVEHTPEVAPQLSENEVEAAATKPESVTVEAPSAEAENDAAALIAQLQELVAQAQAAATAARKAQKKAEAAAASVKQKKEKKGDKKKEKKKDRVLREG